MYAARYFAERYFPPRYFPSIGAAGGRFHLRRQIRDAAAAALTGLTTTGANVFVTRAHPVEESKLPCLLIYTRSEQSRILATDSAGAKTYLRFLELIVEGVAQGVTADDTLDEIAKEVEIALEADVTLGGVSWDLALQDTDLDVFAEGKVEGGSITLSYLVTYHAAADDPTVLLGG